jgi:hypothetical protein
MTNQNRATPYPHRELFKEDHGYSLDPAVQLKIKPIAGMGWC